MSSHHTGGGYSGSASPGHISGTTSSSTTTAGDDRSSAALRDRQARGKDPYESSDGSGDWTSSDSTGYRPGASKEEPFAVLERRRIAAQVLDSPELLMMAAQRDNETKKLTRDKNKKSIPATRLRYTRMLCGFEEPPVPVPARKKFPRVSSGGTPGRLSRKDAR
ncbi:hypothetical protein F4819DRAFT_484328 [Hypoxylon fuscum]|nr:hypothetical protein F4819DRAFT_484328 [Hypoxylon fuscum]